ncbi:hypothetical protein M0R45_026211 [Rubus argutus]|uniref:Uncharacterized protein n=1 Tax=Rubus argutus TaxID=59490 RepID=A0AAW1X094_RUBAR
MFCPLLIPYVVLFQGRKAQSAHRRRLLSKSMSYSQRHLTCSLPASRRRDLSTVSFASVRAQPLQSTPSAQSGIKPPP